MLEFLSSFYMTSVPSLVTDLAPPQPDIIKRSPRIETDAYFRTWLVIRYTARR